MSGTLPVPPSLGSFSWCFFFSSSSFLSVIVTCPFMLYFFRRLWNRGLDCGVYWRMPVCAGQQNLWYLYPHCSHSHLDSCLYDQVRSVLWNGNELSISILSYHTDDTFACNNRWSENGRFVDGKFSALIRINFMLFLFLVVLNLWCFKLMILLNVFRTPTKFH